jgi:multidrug efflux pump subunit AcrA (membrane-fusion protein)
VLIGAGAAVLILGAGGWAVFLRPSDSAAAAVTYRATAVTTGTLRQTVSASGTVAATDTEDLSFPASGAVTAVWVTAGQKVTKGQRLAAIDSASLSSAVAAAKATLATAQAKLASDTASGATSTQLSADSASITVAQGQVTAATTDLTGATLTAPFAGTVTSVGYAVGQQVGSSSGSSGATGSSGSSGGTGTGSGTGQGSGSTSDSTAATSSAIHLVSTGSYEIQASVDATDIARIKAGNQAIITVGDSTQTVFGTVSSVGIVATTTSGVASFPVVVAVTGSPTDVYPGATASLQIVYKQLSDVLLVPTLAISRSNGAATVLVQNGDKQERRTIQTGTSSGAQTQVTGGLTDGEQVLVAVPTGAGNGGTGGTTGRTGRIPGTGGGQGGFPGGGQGGFPGGTGTGTGGGAVQGNGP